MHVRDRVCVLSEEGIGNTDTRWPTRGGSQLPARWP